MADVKITGLSDIGAAIVDTDVFELVDDPGGTPLSRKSAFSRLLTYISITTKTLTNTTFDEGATGNNLTITNAVQALTADEVTQLANIGSTTITADDWTAVAALAGTNTGDELAASVTVSGVAEIATSAETDTGTDAARTVSPDGLAGSYAGTKEITFSDAVDADTAVADGTATVIIPASIGGMDLVSVVAIVNTAGTTNTTDIQIRNVTQTADMLSTKLTIDSAETSSTTAATPAVIDTSNDDVATNDVLAIDIDAVSTTAAKGLVVVLEFRLP